MGRKKTLLYYLLDDLRHPNKGGLPKKSKRYIIDANWNRASIPAAMLPSCKNADLSPDGELYKALESQDKRRIQYYYDENGRLMVMALNGHSVGCGPNPRLLKSLDIDKHKIVYHGTSEKACEKIMKEGLHPMDRAYVHAGTSVATVYGYRKGQEVIIMIDAVNFNKDHPDSPLRIADDDVPVVLSHIPIPPKYLKPVFKEHSSL